MGVNEYIQVGHNTKRARLARGISQKRMAEKLKIPVSTYANYEADNREMPAELIAQVSKLLNEPLLKLLSPTIEEEKTTATGYEVEPRYVVVRRVQAYGKTFVEKLAKVYETKDEALKVAEYLNTKEQE